ncbi:hypothetical protein MSSIT_3565 [Methanosarcina siciliae T4/M]|uniref:Uncharacterized protein n=2 Tax=Methanosarcina siciliae TaxID=38027 RepID=A0A0E3PI14_9EURY|nr:hypothetical protein [Methanosarcina siciliae]AKB30284.1 hypothetical protein MSSIT_3565 [Methanosarcina siciliae T4/M]AKB34192.1 hypothetical protein MSSIH_3502 [Methanosarcina siciliae HI350]
MKVGAWKETDYSSIRKLWFHPGSFVPFLFVPVPAQDELLYSLRDNIVLFMPAEILSAWLCLAGFVTQGDLRGADGGDRIT